MHWRCVGNILGKIGYHVSISEGLDGAVKYSSSIGCETMQIFLSSPRMWSMQKISSENIKRFINKKIELKINPVFVHMPYLPNLASSNNDIYSKSLKTFSETIIECQKLDIEYVVVHLGSYLNSTKEEF